MNCQQREEQILLYAAGQLELAEMLEVRAHLQSGCPVCAGVLAEVETMLAELSGTIAPIVPPPGLFEKVQRRIDGAKKAPGVLVPTSAPRGAAGRPRWLSFALACAGSGLAAAAITWALMWHLAAANRALLDSPDLRLVTLGGSDAGSTARGRVLWDKAANRWQVQVFDLKAPPPGQTFELWYITPAQTKIEAATFNVDQHGRATVSLALPPDIGPLAMAAVTNEPAGGVSQPTGNIVLAGKIQP